MSTATLNQTPRVTPSGKSEEAQPATVTEVESASSRPATSDDGTRVLATLSGAAVLFILVFFLAMMWVLGDYGPPVR